MFTFDTSERLKETMAKRAKKEPVCLLALNKKMREIVFCDEKTVEHHADSSYGLAGLKHMRISSSFVLFFRVFQKERHVLFDGPAHHDKAFKQ